MRLRVLLVLGALISVIVVLVCAALAQGVSRDETVSIQVNRLASLARFVQLSSQAQSDDDLYMLQLEMNTYSELYDEALLIVHNGRQLVSGDIKPSDRNVQEAIYTAGLNLEQSKISEINPFSHEQILITRPFGNSAQVLGSVTMQVNLEQARLRVLQKTAALVLITLSIGAGFLLLADRLTAWVLRPVHSLDDAVQRLSKTKRPVALEEVGPPELRQLSRSVSQMAQAMATSLQQQRELIAETSHQLRNPVAALRLRVDLLKMRLSKPEDVEGLQAVELELGRVESLLDGVLRLASAEHRLNEQAADQSLPRDQRKLERIDAEQILIEEVERQSLRAEQSGNQLMVEASKKSSGPVLAWGNGFELQQMLAELLSNAIKYAPGVLINLNVQEFERTVEIQVQDHGPGMSATDLEHVGERFWRGSTVSSSPGTGLGIAIVDRLARANGGELKLASEQGSGLCATISLRRVTKAEEVEDE